MSKAFTREDGPPPPPLARPPAGGRAPITAAGLQALQQELAALRGDPEASGSARREYLEARLGKLEVISAPNDAARASIAFGARVTLRDEAGEAHRYQLVGPEELDAGKGRVSLDSPIGRALVGKQEGDEVTVERPRGTVKYTVEAVDYD